MNNAIDLSAPHAVTSLLKNRIFTDRIGMLDAILVDNSQQLHITIDNVYRIAFAMFNDGRSFILPLKMLKELSSMNRLLQNDREALLYVRRFENRVCS